MRNNILGNIRQHEFNFNAVWFSEKAYSFRKTTGKVKECEGCYIIVLLVLQFLELLRCGLGLQNL